MASPFPLLSGLVLMASLFASGGNWFSFASPTELSAYLALEHQCLLAYHLKHSSVMDDLGLSRGVEKSHFLELYAARCDVEVARAGPSDACKPIIQMYELLSQPGESWLCEAIADGKFLRGLVEKCANDLNLPWQEISFDNVCREQEHLTASREDAVKTKLKNQRKLGKACARSSR